MRFTPNQFNRVPWYRRWFGQNPLNNIRPSRCITTAFILLFFSATMVFVALSVSLFSDIWRAKNNEQDAKDDYNAALRHYEGASIRRWVPGTVSIGTGMGTNESNVVYEPASIVTVPVPTKGNTDGVNSGASIIAKATLPVTITSPTMLVNFTLNLQNFTPPIVRYTQVTKRQRTGAYCSSSITPPSEGRSMAVQSSTEVTHHHHHQLPNRTLLSAPQLLGRSPASSPARSAASISKARRVRGNSNAVTEVPATFDGVNDGEMAHHAQQLAGDTKALLGVSSSSSSSTATDKNNGVAASQLCNTTEMQDYCTTNYGPFAVYVGSDYCVRGKGCGDCYYYSFLTDYCLVVDSLALGTSDYRIVSDPIMLSCNYPFIDDTLQQYTWSVTPPTSFTVRVFKSDDPWIALQQQTGGSCTFVDENMSGTIVYLICSAIGGVVTLGILALLYNYLQSNFSFTAGGGNGPVNTGNTNENNGNSSGGNNADGNGGGVGLLSFLFGGGGKRKGKQSLAEPSFGSSMANQSHLQQHLEPSFHGSSHHTSHHTLHSHHSGHHNAPHHHHSPGGIRNYNDITSYGMAPAISVMPASDRGNTNNHHQGGNNNANNMSSFRNSSRNNNRSSSAAVSPGQGGGSSADGSNATGAATTTPHPYSQQRYSVMSGVSALTTSMAESSADATRDSGAAEGGGGHESPLLGHQSS